LDGHQVQGQFGFGVRADPPSEEVLSSFIGRRANSLPALSMPALKWIALLGSSLWLGGLFFLTRVFAPAARGASSPMSGDFLGTASRSLRRILFAGALAFASAECLALVGQAVLQLDLPLREVIALAPLRTVLFESHYGHWWMIRMLAVFGLLGLSIRSWIPYRRGSETDVPAVASPGVPVRVAAVILGAVILVSIPMTGHAGALSERSALAVAADWLHLTATVVWVGGLASLGFIVASWRRMDPGNRDFLAVLAERFSWHARICVTLLFVTGAYAAWLHLPGWTSFVSTRYGQTLLVKLILLVPLLAAAFLNLRWVVPALASTGSRPGAPDTPRRLLTLVRAETLFGVAILAAAGILTQLPPASAMSPVNLGPQVRSSRGFEVELQLTPQAVGPNRIVARLRSADGSLVSTARRVTFYLRMLDMEMGLQTIPAENAPDGSYSAEVTLSMAGRWQVSVEIAPPQGDTFVTEFELLAAPP
jgi:copper transport protein